MFRVSTDSPGSGRVGVLHSRADATQLNAEGTFPIGNSWLSGYFKAERAKYRLQTKPVSP